MLWGYACTEHVDVSLVHAQIKPKKVLATPKSWPSSPVTCLPTRSIHSERAPFPEERRLRSPKDAPALISFFRSRHRAPRPSTALNLSDAEMTDGGGPNATFPSPEVESGVQWFGLGLVLIPTATILGNLLVIISVIRFRTLHSAINFLILGLAVADLFVAIFVMPYAVYVYVQGGYWFLGPLMCDIYSASDVACSTASILLLAVISFDRFRAVSRPIQYSRQAQNTTRVIMILVAIWLISFTLASPIVLGVNHRPPDADLYECRFYNAEFSIISSIFSFIIPCFLVLFVYIRIMMALRKRERAARQRRLNNLNCSRRETDRSYEEGDEAGQTVTGPVVNVMMLALPTMTRRIQRWERHREAVEHAGEDEPLDDVDTVEDGDEWCAPPPPSTSLGAASSPLLPSASSYCTRLPPYRSVMQSDRVSDSTTVTTSDTATYSRRREASPCGISRLVGLLSPMAVPAVPKLSVCSGPFSQQNLLQTPATERRHSDGVSPLDPASLPYRTRGVITESSPLMLRRFVMEDQESATVVRRSRDDEHDLAGSSTPHSSSESLSDNLNIIANDFVSEGPTISRRSSEGDNSLANHTLSSFNSFQATLPNEQKTANSGRFHFGRSLRKKHRTVPPRAFSDADAGGRKGSVDFLPTLLRQLSKRSPRIFRRSIGEKLTAHADLKSSDSALSVIHNPCVLGNGATRIPLMDECIFEEGERPRTAQTELDALPSSGVAKLGNGFTHDVSPPEVIHRIPLVKSVSRLPTSSIDAIAERKESKSLVIANEEATKRLSLSTDKRSSSSAEKTTSGMRRISAMSDTAYRSVSTNRVPSSISSTQISGETASKKLSSALQAARRIRSQQSMDSLVASAVNAPSEQHNSSKRKLLATAKQNGSSTALAVRIVKKTISRKDASFKRKVTKAQRKERRATKTLGIVVGIFLVCWVPFFSINIINAVCIKLENPSCQVGYGPFFYATWIGYMNSFMNPVIYTIFNPEFRRAFLKLARLRNNSCFLRSRASAIL